jgi:hypothetical protein
MASSDLQEGGLRRIREDNADVVGAASEDTIAAAGADRTSGDQVADPKGLVDAAGTSNSTNVRLTRQKP